MAENNKHVVSHIDFNGDSIDIKDAVARQAASDASNAVSELAKNVVTDIAQGISDYTIRVTKNGLAIDVPIKGLSSKLDELTEAIGGSGGSGGNISLDSPEFTGIPKAPTAASGSDTTQIANTKFVQSELAARSTAQQNAINAAYENATKYADTKIAELVDGAPETMDTLKEVSEAIQANKDVETALNEAIGKKADTILYDKSANTLYLKSGSTVLSSTEIKSGGGATITPKPTVNPQIENGNGKVIITWEDPTDVIYDGATFSQWAGTKLVMKEDGYPTSPDDGTLLVDNTTRDKYKTTGFEKSGLTNDTVYYFALFPYSTDGVYNYDSGNRLLGEPTEEFKIVTFASGTDEEIAKMIQAHYNDEINIADYWAVGDTRNVALSSMSATGVGESHRAQTVQFVIGDFEHDDLTTPINGHTKAAVTLLQKDCLMDASNASNPVNGSGNTEKGYMNSSGTNSGGWKNCARRTWCNNVYYNALPSVWKSIVKTVNKKSGTGGGSSSGTKTTQDKIFLASEIEIFGSTNYSVDGEGTRYQYYENATANRYKMPKWSSSDVSNVYFERSPRSGDPDFFCFVSSGGSLGSGYANTAYGVAPCLCI